MSNRYLIWSEEHLAWWGRDPTNFNYTRSIQHARRYSKEEAAKIVANANRFLKPGMFSREFVVADPVDPEMRGTPDRPPGRLSIATTTRNIGSF